MQASRYVTFAEHGVMLGELSVVVTVPSASRRSGVGARHRCWR